MAAIPFLEVAVSCKLILLLFDVYLSSRQRARYKQTVPSTRVAALIPSRKFQRAQSYGHARMTFSMCHALFHGTLGALLALMYVHPQLWELSRRAARALGFAESELAQTLIFFAVVGIIEMTLDLPTSLYSTFVIEARFGFNRTSLRTFLSDGLLSIFFSAIFGAPIIVALFYTLQFFASWPSLVLAAALWCLLAVLILVMMVIFPSVIAPRFNKYTPLQDGPLREELERMARRLKFPLSKIYVIDGSRRSSHSNAYFAGIFSKFICIYDSLIEQTKGKDSQVVAVLCHELGHWAHSHTVLGVVISLVHLAIICLLYGLTAGNPDLYKSFGYDDGTMPKVIGFLLFSEMLTPLDAVLKPLGNVLSRHFEYQADQFAKAQGMQKELGQALVSMHVNNLSNMSPDPLYATWNYSHPTLLERLDALDVHVEAIEVLNEGKEE